MTTRWLLSSLGLFALSAALLGSTPPAPKLPKQSVPNPFAPRFKQVRDRIDSMFEHRREPPSAPDPLGNPFRVPGVLEPKEAAAERASEPVDAPTSLTQLQEAAATLRVSGTVEINGRTHLIINSRPYRQGDVVQTQVRGEAVYLRVRDIAKRLVTLALNDAEMTLKF